MRSDVNERVVWSLRGNVAELSCGKLFARIDTSRPNVGLYDVMLDGRQQAAELLRVYRSDVTDEQPWPLPLAESYVRGDDLVASYRAADVWPFSPQLYWRVDSLHAVEGVIASTSLLISAQTHLLDTVPQIAVGSLMPCEELLLVAVDGGLPPRAVRIESSQTISCSNGYCCALSRLRDMPLSYVEIMPAGDFHAVSRRAEGRGAAFEWRLFAEFLEKGVIRRARIHAAILPREHDIQIAAACCLAIDQLELPLTT